MQIHLRVMLATSATVQMHCTAYQQRKTTAALCVLHALAGAPNQLPARATGLHWNRVLPANTAVPQAPAAATLICSAHMATRATCVVHVQLDMA
jgi:hypothetical protein